MPIATDNMELEAPAGPVQVNIASGASTPYLASAPAETPIQQKEVDPVPNSAEHAEFTVREYTNVRCTACNLAVYGYLVQVTLCENDNKCPRGGDILEVIIKLPPPPGQTFLVFEGSLAQWFTQLKDATVGNNICKSAALRKKQAARRFGWQRKGEAPTLAPGFFDSATNWHRVLEPRPPN